MQYEDYKQEWEEFFSTPMRFSFNSASMDLGRLSDEDPEDIAHVLVQKVITKFCNGMSSGRYYKYFVIDNWCQQFVRQELFDKCVALIKKSREEDKKNG